MAKNMTVVVNNPPRHLVRGARNLTAGAWKRTDQTGIIWWVTGRIYDQADDLLGDILIYSEQLHYPTQPAGPLKDWDNTDFEYLGSSITVTMQA